MHVPGIYQVLKRTIQTDEDPYLNVQATVEPCGGNLIHHGRIVGCNSQVAVEVEGSAIIMKLDSSYRNPQVYINNVKKIHAESIRFGPATVPTDAPEKCEDDDKCLQARPGWGSQYT